MEVGESLKTEFYKLFNIAETKLFDDGGLTSTGYGVIAFAAIAVIVVIAMYIPNILNKKKGMDSPAKKRVEQIVNEISNGDSVTPAYANWMTSESRPMEGKRIQRFWYYAIGFNKDRIYIAPLSISGKDGENITYKNAFRVERSQLGHVNGKKNGKWMELYDKEKKKICTLKVEAVNTKDALGNAQFNLTQPEAAKAWQEQVNLWLDMVNSANGTQATGFYNNAKGTDIKGQFGSPKDDGSAKNV